VRPYSDEFKLTAVRLSQQAGMQVQTVAVRAGARRGDYEVVRQ
jgi:transposase-like protein